MVSFWSISLLEAMINKRVHEHGFLISSSLKNETIFEHGFLISSSLKNETSYEDIFASQWQPH
jgi:hypothetical protein